MMGAGCQENASCSKVWDFLVKWDMSEWDMGDSAKLVC